MTHSLSAPCLVRFACATLAIAALAACGGAEPTAKAPEPAVEQNQSEAGGVSTSAEIGGLNEESVDRTFKSALADFQSCIDDGAKRVEFLGGSANFLVQIDRHGKADDTYLEKSTIGDRETEECMLNALRSKHWPKPVGGEHGLARKSFDFDPPNDVRAPTVWDERRVSEAISKLSRKLKACKEGSTGAFEATMYVATNGSVLAAGVTPPDKGGEADVDCLVSTLKEASFPSPGSWPAKVTFRL